MTHVDGPMKPLVQWMHSGDPDLVPILLGDARSTAASYFGMTTRDEMCALTPEMVVQCCRETGIHLHRGLGAPTHADVIAFLEDIELTAREEHDTDGTVKRITTIMTPAGVLSETYVAPVDRPPCWVDHLVKSDADLPALSFLIERMAQASQDDPRVREHVTSQLQTEARKWPASTLLNVVLGVPTFAITSNWYMDPTLAFYLLLDYPAEMERIFEAYEQANVVWMDCAAAAGADATLGAINGLELYSPDIYQRYFVPQARKLHASAHAHGMLGWVHTCGQMRRLIEMAIYADMAVDVLESLSSPPLGDVADLHCARARLGGNLVTRGAVNVDYFYAKDLDSMRAETRRVLAGTRGWKHMIGDTNDSFPPYPRENILILVDEVRKSGRMLAYTG